MNIPNTWDCDMLLNRITLLYSNFKWFTIGFFIALLTITKKGNIDMGHILFQTANGKVFKCGKCSKIHVEYQNLNFNFTEVEYTRFATYIQNLDGKFWEEQNTNLQYRRKIFIPIGHKNINLLLNNSELLELKSLMLPLNSETYCKQQIYVGSKSSFLFLN